MYRTLCLALASTVFATSAFAADRDASEFVIQDDEITYFNYKSDVCNSMKDEKELYNVAMSLRDSADKKEQVAALDCMTISAVRGYAPAEYELARMYAVGSIVMQSSTFAYRWAQMAVMDRYEPAIQLRDSLEKELSNDDFESALNDARRIYEEREHAKKADNAGAVNNFNNRNKHPRR